MKAIRDLLARHKAGERAGITSVCSAHPLVLEATLRHALAHDAPLVLIEATSNQVNQDGGYTGMRPADFRDFVWAIADRVGFPRGRLALGGDRLRPAQVAQLVVRDRAAAGARRSPWLPAARQGVGRVEHDQCDALRAGPPVRL